MVRLVDGSGADRGSNGPRRLLPRLLLSSLTLCAPAGAAAQVAPQVVPPTREEVSRPETPPVRNGGAQLQVEGGLERAPCALDSPQFKDVRFTLRGAVIDGLQGLSPSDLAPAYADMIGKEQPISAVCDIRDRTAAILRAAGYIASVEVPEQRIADGMVRFKVLMAHLGLVRVRGNATGAERIIAAYLNALTKQPVFNRYEAERYLLLASDLPGYAVRMTLRPAGTTPGEVLGDVTVQRTAIYADSNIQNGGSNEVGPWGALVRAQFFGLTGLADRTTVAAFTTADFDEQQTLQIGHDMRLGSNGLGVGGEFTYAWAHPTIATAGINVRARTLLATLHTDYPIVRTLPRTLRASFGIDFINQTVDLNSKVLTRDRLRVGFARLGFDAMNTDFSQGRSQAEPLWHVNSLLEFRKGLDILGASEPCGPKAVECLGAGDVAPSRVEGLATATVVRALLYGEYRPVPKVTFALGARAQYAWDPLLSFEEFSAGNYTVGRGYDPGVLLGDRGWGTQAEIRVGSTIPSNASKAGVEGYVFWDHAQVENFDRLAPEIVGSKHLNSVGAGARVDFARFSLDANLAFPLTRVGAFARKGDPRILISLSSRLWPWTYK